MKGSELKVTGKVLQEIGEFGLIHRIPLSRLYQKWVHSFSKDLFQFALLGGEDYELLFTAQPELRKSISSLARSLRIPITRIGEILPIKEGLHIIKKDGKDDSSSRLGFEHFR